MNFEKWDALHTTIHFGKYKGEILENILQEDPSYLQWLLEVSTAGSLRDSLEIIQDDIAKAVECERDDILDMYSGYPDPMWD